MSNTTYKGCNSWHVNLLAESDHCLQRRSRFVTPLGELKDEF
jgi:hypothetical protein